MHRDKVCLLLYMWTKYLNGRKEVTLEDSVEILRKHVSFEELALVLDQVCLECTQREWQEVRLGKSNLV